MEVGYELLSLDGKKIMVGEDGLPLNGEYFYAVTQDGELLITSSVTGLIDLFNTMPPETTPSSLGSVLIEEGEYIGSKKWNPDNFLDIRADEFGWIP